MDSFYVNFMKYKYSNFYMNFT